MDERLVIIEIGSNNTKTHVYQNNDLIYDNTTTIEFKKNYKNENKILESDLDLLNDVIRKALDYSKNVHIYGCSIFRNISEHELEDINQKLLKSFGLKIEVVSQEDEALYTALGSYGDIDYDKNICVFIGGGGSTELIFVKNKQIVDKKFFNFGVVDVTSKFDSLKDDIPTVAFEEVYKYIDGLMGDIDDNTDVLILAGGDHLYWYNNARYELLSNQLYSNKNQKYMITREMSDEYDRNAYIASLDRIRQNSDNPKWFDGSRAMKTITNLVSHKVNAKYIIPTKINMEDGLRKKLENKIN